jgi:hypothetical protein
MSKELIAYLDGKGTARKLTVHDTPEENGVSERLNRTLMEKVRAMLWAAGLPRYLWGEALLHAAYLKNRTSTKALKGHTPYEAINGKPPNLRNLPEWGCKVWVHDTKTGKVGTRAKEGRWVGYDENSNANRIYWPDKRSVAVERNVKFSQTYEPTPLDDDMVLEGENEPLDETTSSTLPPAPPAPMPEVEPQRRSSRTRKPSQYIRDIQAGKGSAQGKNRPELPRGMTVPEATIEEVAEEEDGNDHGQLEEVIPGVAMAAKMAEAHGLEPVSLAEAMKSPDWPRWQEAMDEELKALEKFGTWQLEKPLPKVNIVGC